MTGKSDQRFFLGSSEWMADAATWPGPSVVSLVAALLFCALFAGCGRSDPSTARPRAESSRDDEVTIQLNWYPEAEHGGVYQALADGTYADAGLEVDIRPGGRAVAIAPELEMQRAQFAIINADDVVIFRRQGIDVVAVLAAMKQHPRCILVRADSGVESFDDLAGLTLQRQPGRMFLDFLRERGVLDQVREVSYNGVSGLATDRKMAIQAYSFAEPLQARQQGIETRCLMVSELGWNPYSSVLVTTGSLIRNEPDLVEKVVKATQKGWQEYLQRPESGNAAILKVNNYGMTAEALQFGHAELQKLALPADAPVESVGRMSQQRWETLVRQIDELDPEYAGEVTAAECFTNQFLN